MNHDPCNIDNDVIRCLNCGIRYVDNSNEKDSIYRYAILRIIKDKGYWEHTNVLPTCDEYIMDEALG